MVMIINDDFDRTLWLILVGDSENRYDIAKFISSFPKEMVERIHRELEKCNTENDSVIKKNFSKAFRNDKGNTYLYAVNINGNEIKLKFSVFGNTTIQYEENVELSIVCISLEKIKSMNSMYAEYIGNYLHICTRLSLFTNCPITNKNDRSYELVDGNQNDVIVQTFDENFSKHIVLDMIPSEIHMDDLYDKRSVNRLVKIKNKYHR